MIDSIQLYFVFCKSGTEYQREFSTDISLLSLSIDTHLPVPIFWGGLLLTIPVSQFLPVNLVASSSKSPRVGLPKCRRLQFTAAIITSQTHNFISHKKRIKTKPRERALEAAAAKHSLSHMRWKLRGQIHIYVRRAAFLIPLINIHHQLF